MSEEMMGLDDHAVPGGGSGVDGIRIPEFRRLPGRLFRAVAAVSENGVIGADGGLPWRLREDFRWFRRLTWGGVLVMGRVTYEGIGRPLPGRDTVVLSRSGAAFHGAEVVRSWNELEVRAAVDSRTWYLCGGAAVYEDGLSRSADLLLTRVKRVVEGDARFPDPGRDFVAAAVLYETDEFRIEHWLARGG